MHGKIAPKGSRTAGVRRDGTHYSRPASPHEVAFTEVVAREAMVARSRSSIVAPPYRVDLAFLFAKPRRPAVPWPCRIDVDKAVRAVLDGLVRGGLLEDDRHVTELVARKRWSDGLEHLAVVVSHAATGSTLEEPRTATKEGSAWTPPPA